MPRILQRHYHAAYIIGPWLVRIAFDGLSEVERIDRVVKVHSDNMHGIIVTPAGGNHRRWANCAGQDKPVIIVGMLADQIHPSGRAGHQIRR